MPAVHRLYRRWWRHWTRDRAEQGLGDRRTGGLERARHDRWCHGL